MSIMYTERFEETNRDHSSYEVAIAGSDGYFRIERGDVQKTIVLNMQKAKKLLALAKKVINDNFKMQVEIFSGLNEDGSSYEVRLIAKPYCLDFKRHDEKLSILISYYHIHKLIKTLKSTLKEFENSKGKK